MKKRLRLLVLMALAVCLILGNTMQVLAEKPGDTVTVSATINPGVSFDGFSVKFTYTDGLEFVSITDTLGVGANTKTASGSTFAGVKVGATTVTITLTAKVKADATGEQTLALSSAEYSTKTEEVGVAGNSKKITVEVPEVWGEWKIDKQPTCTEEGERSRESDKGTKETEKIPALKHDYQPGKILEEATCTKVGKQEFVCKNDPTHKEIRDIPMLEHKASEWEIVVAPDPEKKLDGKRVKRCLVGGEVLVEEVIPYVTTIYFPNNTASTQGLRFRDMKPELGRKWFMFTPVDLSADGEQIIPIIASNAYYVGKAMVNVADGAVTVTYEFPKAVKVKSEFLTLFADLASVSTVNPAELAEQAFTFGEPINIEEALGGDTKVLLYTNFVIDYNDSIRGVTRFFTGNKDYRAAVAAMKELMD